VGGKPVDADEINRLGEQFRMIAKQHVSEELGIDIPLITRATRYLTRSHPPMGEDTRWFLNMLQVVLEIARPNCGLDEPSRAFLKDMLDGIHSHMEDE
jgi:hypothetical protein